MHIITSVWRKIREESIVARLPYLRGRTPAAVVKPRASPLALERLLRRSRLRLGARTAYRRAGRRVLRDPRRVRARERGAARAVPRDGSSAATSLDATIVRVGAGTYSSPVFVVGGGGLRRGARLRARLGRAPRFGAELRRGAPRGADALAVLGLGDAERGPARRRPRSALFARAPSERVAPRGEVAAILRRRVEDASSLVVDACELGRLHGSMG